MLYEIPKSEIVQEKPAEPVEVQDSPTKESRVGAESGKVNLDNVDVSYEKSIVAKKLDIADDKVKDRWSRYIGAMGLDAVKKQSKA